MKPTSLSWLSITGAAPILSSGNSPATSFTVVEGFTVVTGATMTSRACIADLFKLFRRDFRSAAAAGQQLREVAGRDGFDAKVLEGGPRCFRRSADIDAAASILDHEDGKAGTLCVLG